MGEIDRQLEDKGIILMQGGINIVVQLRSRSLNLGRVKAWATSQSTTCKQAGMSKNATVVNLNPPIAILLTQVLTKTILFNAKQSGRLVCMTAYKRYAHAGNETARYADVAYKFEKYG